jgi:hypothetical protein
MRYREPRGIVVGMATEANYFGLTFDLAQILAIFANRCEWTLVARHPFQRLRGLDDDDGAAKHK